MIKNSSQFLRRINAAVSIAEKNETIHSAKYTFINSQYIGKWNVGLFK